jgi:pimeloyl-ACP methyl ester carboxylesterase
LSGERSPEAEKLIVVGHDSGGVVAWFYAVYHPEHLEKLITVNAPHPASLARQLAINREQAVGQPIHVHVPQPEEALSANHYVTLEPAVLAPGLARGYITGGKK